METSQNPDKKNASVPATSDSSLIQKGFEPIQFFKKDKNFFFVHQKIEKLVAAVYMLTNFMAQEEPMKWSLRTRGIELLRLNIDLKKGGGSEQGALESGIREYILEIVSLLEIASFSGLVSEMNFIVLKREFYGLLDNIQKTTAKHANGSLLHSPFFDISEPKEEKEEKRGSHDINYSSFNSENNPKDEIYVQKQDIKDKIHAPQDRKNTEPPSQPKSLKEYGPVAVKKNKRQAAIINLLKRKKEIMIKDVSSIIHECSEKTIQRELSSLVIQGVLHKEGERRWTRYTLA